MFREYLLERLTTAGLEICEAMKKTFAEDEEQILCSKEETVRLRQLLDVVTLPEVKPHLIGSVYITLYLLPFLYLFP